MKRFGGLFKRKATSSSQPDSGGVRGHGDTSSEHCEATKAEPDPSSPPDTCGVDSGVQVLEKSPRKAPTSPPSSSNGADISTCRRYVSSENISMPPPRRVSRQERRRKEGERRKRERKRKSGLLFW